MSHSIIRFPPPPPTRNNLTAEQRAQLMRSNKKLGQVLGSTPHIVDFSLQSVPLHVNIPARRSDDILRSNSLKSHTRAKSLPQIDENSEGERSSSPASPRPSSSRSSRSSSKNSIHSVDSERAWRTPYHPAQRPPLLKLFPADTTPTSMPEALFATEAERSFPDSPTAPTFDIASEASLRMRKMRRLTRKLGEGIPIELVFPPSVSDVDSDDEESPLLTTPSSDHKLPFSKALPAIPEGALPSPPLRTRHEAQEQSVRTSSFVQDRKRDSYRDAVYVVDSPDEHGLERGLENLCIGISTSSDKTRNKPSKHSGKSTKGQKVCVGVSASAGLSGQGRSRRWVEGPIPFDQIAGSWSGRGW
ncbi:uncharacterized protein FIBRA_05577 [Fibroporia radiculosa]|uniref:Uncharacterized protein n=1 Tax=Fibroporia radiculosa TaxID=599839 RepID=J4H3L3_9APHY|nr:uncharacterized protein FIBRA_05577 [Fibroporia radiculosa]CCM03444.1 predicted protein [Fibroporia radiculosa]